MRRVITVVALALFTGETVSKLSKEKGKRGERGAAKFLESLGFKARRGVQYHGGPKSPDILSDELENLHFEVKFSHDIDLGKKSLEDAVQQAETDAGGKKQPVVLWKQNRRSWRLTFISEYGLTTVFRPEDIRLVLVKLNEKRML